MTDPLLLAAIAPYGITLTSSTTLRTLSSRIERIADTNGIEYALQVYVPEQFNIADSNSEMIWLDYVVRQGTVAVPQPVATQSGKFIAEFTYEGRARHASLFHWIEGEDASGELTLPVMERIGEAIAHLHNAARAFIPPPDFDRPRYDWVYIAGVFEWQKRTQGILSDADRKTLTNAALKVIAEMEYLGTSPEVFGIIHSDLHFGNFLRSSDFVSVIDFGDFGFGHYVLDLMTPVLELNDDPPQMKARLEALLDGYRKIAPLPYQTNRQMAIFIMAQSLIFLEWVFTAENPEVKEKKLQWVRATIDGIAHTLEILERKRG